MDVNFKLYPNKISINANIDGAISREKIVYLNSPLNALNNVKAIPIEKEKV